MFDPERALESVNQVLAGGIVPQNTALNLSAERVEQGRIVMRLPWNEKLVGNPARGILHGGAITTLLDGACGMAIFLAMPRPTRIATIDLRIDYMAASEKGRDVLCLAECTKLTRQVAFGKAVAYHDDPEVPIASAVGTFMIFPNEASPTGHAIEESEGGDG